MRTSPTTKNIAAALLKAQSEMGSAKKESKNPFFKSNYADLGSVMEVVKGPLNTNNLVIMQPVSYKDGKQFITTRIEHSLSGEWYEADSEVIVSKLNDAQAAGAGQTYARRFSLQSFLFIPSEDDDGNLASGRSVKTQAASSVYPGTKPASTLTPEIVAKLDAMVPVTTLEPLKSSSFRKRGRPANSETPLANGHAKVPVLDNIMTSENGDADSEVQNWG